eukprot:scaffold505400_cov19-Prasinocladus_malaysianus.AAC.2
MWLLMYSQSKPSEHSTSTLWDASYHLAPDSTKAQRHIPWLALHAYHYMRLARGLVVEMSNLPVKLPQKYCWIGDLIQCLNNASS